MKAVEIAFTIFFNVATLGMWGLGTYLTEKKKEAIAERIAAFLTAPTTTTEAKGKWQFVYAVLYDKTATAVPTLYDMLKQIVKKQFHARPMHCEEHGRPIRSKEKHNWGACAYSESYDYDETKYYTLVQDFELMIFCGDLETMYKLLKNFKSMDKLAQVCYIMDNLDAFHHLVLCASRAKKLKDARLRLYKNHLRYGFCNYRGYCNYRGKYPIANTNPDPLADAVTYRIILPSAPIPD